MYLIILGVQLSGAVPVGFLAILSFAAVVIILSYQWYLLRIALEVSPIAAVGLVASEFILGQLIRGVGQNMLR